MSCVSQDATRFILAQKFPHILGGGEYCLHLPSNLKTEESNSATVLCDVDDSALTQSRTYECSQQGWYPGNLSFLFVQYHETTPEQKWKTLRNSFRIRKEYFVSLFVVSKLNITQYLHPTISVVMTISSTLKPRHLQYCSKTQKGTKHLLSGQGLPVWFHEPTSTLYRSLLSETILVDVVNPSRLLSM